MTTALIFLSNLLIIAAVYFLGRMHGKARGRCDGLCVHVVTRDDLIALTPVPAQ